MITLLNGIVFFLLYIRVEFPNEAHPVFALNAFLALIPSPTAVMNLMFSALLFTWLVVSTFSLILLTSLDRIGTLHKQIYRTLLLTDRRPSSNPAWPATKITNLKALPVKVVTLISIVYSYCFLRWRWDPIHAWQPTSQPASQQTTIW